MMLQKQKNKQKTLEAGLNVGSNSLVARKYVSSLLLVSLGASPCWDSL